MRETQVFAVNHKALFRRFFRFVNPAVLGVFGFMLAIKIIANELSKGDLVRGMVDLGAASKDALSNLEAINEGFKAGTLSVVTGGLSAEGYAPGQNVFFDLAFRKGKAAMRFTTPFWVLVKSLVPLVVAAVILVAIVYAVLR